jgi:hypothetical protein
MAEAEPPASLATQLRASAGAGAAKFRERLAAWRAQEPAATPRRAWQVAGAVALLIALGPVATIAGGHLLAGQSRAESRQLKARAEPRIAADRLAERDRAALGAVLRRAGVGAVIEALARALPPEAALARAERNRDGLIELDIATPDPDKLRAALRREPLLATLRDSGQRQGDAAMLVSFRESAE